MRSLKFENQVFDHNFARSARIELRFWEVANLEKLNNFCHDHFESLLTKKWLFCSFGLYLARARARARPGLPELGGLASRTFKKDKVKQVLTRARVEMWPTSSFDFHRISFAVEAPPVFKPSHMAELVASDLLIFIETCVF